MKTREEQDEDFVRRLDKYRHLNIRDLLELLETQEKLVEFVVVEAGLSGAAGNWWPLQDAVAEYRILMERLDAKKDKPR